MFKWNLAACIENAKRKLTCVIRERSNPEAENMDDWIAFQHNQFLRKSKEKQDHNEPTALPFLEYIFINTI